LLNFPYQDKQPWFFEASKRIITFKYLTLGLLYLWITICLDLFHTLDYGKTMPVLFVPSYWIKRGMEIFTGQTHGFAFVLPCLGSGHFL
jgi:hypothetical protein